MKEERYDDGALLPEWCYATSELSEKGKVLDARLKKCLELTNTEIHTLKEVEIKLKSYYHNNIGNVDLGVVKDIIKDIGYKDIDLSWCLDFPNGEFDNKLLFTLGVNMSQLSYFKDHIIQFRRYLRKGHNFESMDNYVSSFLDILLGTEEIENSN